MTPRFVHHCTSCTLIGQTKTDDLYVCPQGTVRTIISRHGDDDRDYTIRGGYAMTRLAYYRDALGFDRAEHIPFTRQYRIRCSQCDALVINGRPCHETGCPNTTRPELEEEED
jgi:hypothetical protein